MGKPNEQPGHKGEWISEKSLLWGAGFFVTYLIYKKTCVIAARVLASFVGRLSVATVLALLLVAIALWSKRYLVRRLDERNREKAILGPAEGAVFSGVTSDGDELHVKPNQRTMHTEVIGTTNAGKTESVILPWAIQDLEQGRGLILIDGKADRSLLESSGLIQ